MSLVLPSVTDSCSDKSSYFGYEFTRDGILTKLSETIKAVGAMVCRMEQHKLIVYCAFLKLTKNGLLGEISLEVYNLTQQEVSLDDFISKLISKGSKQLFECLLVKRSMLTSHVNNVLKSLNTAP